MAAPAPKGVLIFKARKRVLLDLILFFDIVIFVLSLALQFSLPMLFAAILVTSGVVTVAWVLVIRPLVRVEMTEHGLSGTSRRFGKVKIHLGKVDIRRTNAPSEGLKRRFFYKDIWTVDGECLRLYRRILGERQVSKIMTVVERYPLRDAVMPPKNQS